MLPRRQIRRKGSTLVSRAACPAASLAASRVVLRVESRVVWWEGLPAEAPPPTVVRIGGSIVAPKLVRQVKPAYPSVATQARVRGLVILEAQVDVHGAVKSLKVLRGPPLLEEAAMEAVRQWRYQPLLLNGEPREFILTVTVVFNLAPVGS